MTMSTRPVEGSRKFEGPDHTEKLFDWVAAQERQTNGRFHGDTYDFRGDEAEVYYTIDPTPN